MAVVVVIHYSCMSMRASILSAGRGMLGFPAVPSVPCLREHLAATGGCSEAGFGGSQAAISAPATLHQGCLAHRQNTVCDPYEAGKMVAILVRIFVIVLLLLLLFSSECDLRNHL